MFNIPTPILTCYISVSVAINLCASDPCKNGAICNNLVTSETVFYTCTCIVGWQGPNCDIGKEILITKVDYLRNVTNKAPTAPKILFFFIIDIAFAKVKIHWINHD